jgi:hypothetical protein
MQTKNVPIVDRFAPNKRSAHLLAFPLARRHSLVKKLAGQMLDRSPLDADKHLTLALGRHRRLLKQKQFPNAVIDAQLRAFEAAVRGELWQRVMLEPRGGHEAGRP